LTTHGFDTGNCAFEGSQGNKRQKKRLVEDVPFWWHSIDLGDDIMTRGHASRGDREKILSAIPADLRGKKVLDIGCWDGLYSFECEKRGAEVCAIDNRQQEAFVASHYGVQYDTLSGFRVARKLLNSKVKFREMDLYDLRGSRERHDIVLLLGVLYHLKYPLLALEIVSALTRDFVLVESHYIVDGETYPHMRFYPSNELNNDPTNHWGPNLSCIKTMLRAAGFHRIELLKTWRDRVLIKAAKS